MAERGIGVWTVVYLGLLLATLHIAVTLHRLYPDAPTTVITVRLLIGVVLPISLIGAGFWLAETDYSPERRWRIAVWSVGGLVFMTVITAWGLYVSLFTVPGGTDLPVENFVLNTQAGAVAGFVVGTYYVNASRRADELERYEAFIKNSSDGIMHVSEDGELLYESPVPENPLGYVPGGQVGDNIFEYIHPDDREDALENFAEFLRYSGDDTGRMRLRVEDAEGGYRWVEVAAAEQTDTEMGGVVISLREVTDRVRRERELEETKRKLEQSNEQLEQFAYVASHDLKEPLRMVSSYLDLLSEEYGDELDDEAREYIVYATDGADRMRKMIDGLLEYSRVETQESGFAEVDTEEVLEGVLHDLEFLMYENGAEVTYDRLPNVHGDANQIGQLLQNLIKNAVEHSGEEPAVVHVGVNDRDDMYEFFVEDEGVGIPEDEHDSIFEMFRKGSGGDGGTGIGLAVCSRIVEGHGGDIRVESVEGEGTTFYFTLPKSEHV